MTGKRNMDFDQDEFRELSDEELETLSGGRGRKLLCPRGTRKVCGTIDGVYKCRCIPNTSPAASPADSQSVAETAE